MLIEKVKEIILVTNNFIDVIDVFAFELKNMIDLLYLDKYLHPPRSY